MSAEKIVLVSNIENGDCERTKLCWIISSIELNGVLYPWRKTEFDCAFYICSLRSLSGEKYAEDIILSKTQYIQLLESVKNGSSEISLKEYEEEEADILLPSVELLLQRDFFPTKYFSYFLIGYEHSETVATLYISSENDFKENDKMFQLLNNKIKTINIDMKIKLKYLLIPNCVSLQIEDIERDVTITAADIQLLEPAALLNTDGSIEQFAVFYFVDCNNESVDNKLYALLPNAFIALKEIFENSLNVTEICFDPNQY